mgnify:CR=1 FL=1
MLYLGILSYGGMGWQVFELMLLLLFSWWVWWVWQTWQIDGGSRWTGWLMGWGHLCFFILGLPVLLFLKTRMWLHLNKPQTAFLYHHTMNYPKQFPYVWHYLHWLHYQFLLKEQHHNITSGMKTRNIFTLTRTQPVPGLSVPVPDPYRKDFPESEPYPTRTRKWNPPGTRTRPAGMGTRTRLPEPVPVHRYAMSPPRPLSSGFF